MNRTTEIVLEYLSPQLAKDMMARFHASLPDDPEERKVRLNEVHRELHFLVEVKPLRLVTQITPGDFRAPAGLYRIIQESGSDGQFDFVGDFPSRTVATIILESLREGMKEDIFTLCDENGALEL